MEPKPSIKIRFSGNLYIDRFRILPRVSPSRKGFLQKACSRHFFWKYNMDSLIMWFRRELLQIHSINSSKHFIRWTLYSIIAPRNHLDIPANLAYASEGQHSCNSSKFFSCESSTDYSEFSPDIFSQIPGFFFSGTYLRNFLRILKETPQRFLLHFF